MAVCMCVFRMPVGLNDDEIEMASFETCRRTINNFSYQFPVYVSVCGTHAICSPETECLKNIERPRSITEMWLQENLLCIRIYWYLTEAINETGSSSSVLFFFWSGIIRTDGGIWIGIPYHLVTSWVISDTCLPKYLILFGRGEGAGW